MEKTAQTLPARLIAIEGIDQSGKKTQTRLLANNLKRLHLRVGVISFPIYESASGKKIRSFLYGRQDYPPAALHVLYSINRWENQNLIRKMIDTDDFVIADRYSASNLAYGMSRGLSFKWLRELDKGLPQPNLVIVLDAPVKSSFSRKSTGRDVHEKNSQLLVKVRQNYKVLARRLHWKIVEASGPVSIVESSIWKLVRKRFKIDLKTRSK